MEAWADGDWMVRPVTGTAATKTYRCPGCDQLIAAGIPHLVTWPAGQASEAGLASRRHWHRPCWQARDRRRANVQRSRNAPRYG